MCPTSVLRRRNIAATRAGLAALLRESKLPRNDPNPTGPSPTDRERLWSAKLGHPIQHVARELRLDHLPTWSSGSQTIAENRFVPEEGILHAGLAMTTCLLLPSAPAQLRDLPDRAIASARPRSASGQPGRLDGWNHDLCATLPRGVVEGDRVIGRVRRDAGHIAIDGPGASGVRTVGMQLKGLTGTREVRQVQAALVGSDELPTRGRPDDLAEVRLADSTPRSGEPATWGSGQRKLSRSRAT